ncbi:head GIN domain-containing protein [Sphingosinicella sp. LHD-64]|uniref:head GIN domain-containing protein n=1 Tax=Sphingosinicella sp. LHD-64 TaxID=3072139 RepID=UPI0028107EA4|nr:head GIN domain-containing protein [Sphingosinicella sp. LHD-64]MDQ8756100.1 head GIN domain-containing protein [Sphingosinicella sp. LHD-64]
MRTMPALLVPAMMLIACPAHAGNRERMVNASSDRGIEVRYSDETPVEGSGRRIRQARPAGDFTRVIVDDALDAEITIGPRAAIELEGDDNLVDRIRADARDGRLHLRVEGGYRVRQPMIARITVPRLDGVDLRASGDVLLTGLTDGRLALTGEGSGSFRADGRVDEVEVRIQGSGDADLERLRARSARVVINGSGNVRAQATEAMAATVNGSGNITYSGRPRQVSEDVNGSGSIRAAAN